VPKNSNLRDVACSVSSATRDAASRVSTNLAGVNATKEFEFLCACSGVELSPERIARIEGWNESGIDWSELLRLAEHHGVLPLLTRNLIEHAPRVPPQIEKSLRSAFDENARRNLWFASELIRITNQFEKKHLPAIPYKGPVLAESAYGDVALRNFGDLDFLITPADFERAKQALAELGYRPSKEMSAAVERFWLRNGYECAFDGTAGKYLVELQWGFLPRFYSVDLGLEELLARAGRTVLGGRTLTSLSAEDSLLVLCVHAAKHLWMRLIWICDIAETMRTQVVDWEVVCGRAREIGVVRMVAVSFFLVRTLFGISMPGPAQEIVDGDPRVRDLGEQFAARLARSAVYDFESTEYFRWILNLRERRRDRVRYMWRLTWTPGEGDIAAVRLPEALFPLYRVVRLVRLMRKFF
jgi:hypothetical protein